MEMRRVYSVRSYLLWWILYLELAVATNNREGREWLTLNRGMIVQSSQFDSRRQTRCIQSSQVLSQNGASSGGSPDWSKVKSYGSSCTAPDDGFVLIRTGGLKTSIAINGRSIASWVYEDNWYYDTLLFPVVKNDIVSCSGDHTASILFMPYK